MAQNKSQGQTEAGTAWTKWEQVRGDLWQVKLQTLGLALAFAEAAGMGEHQTEELLALLVEHELADRPF